ncbi:MAG: 6-phosphogluconate dehydrogenase [Betaproteobacteria bacterium]|jgi:2-hydroxy-3-oxopropionate reductase|nr:6-phosphogluconate dehydrogenase [Betaproteobacteria bacterium]MEA3154587.1 2-hydroxy-3-oxopropionate reductase [Betaproteobacteria bacterium]
MTARVGVIGLGVLGRPVAERLLAKGFDVAVYDVRDEPMAALKRAGAVACASPAEVAQRSEFIMSLVSDAAQTDDVVFGESGILNTLREQAVFIIGSTLGQGPVQKVAQALAERDAETLDAPISGGYLAAHDGTLSMMIGGQQSVLDRALPVLQAIARTITRAGDVGAGQAAKLAHQLVFSLNVMALLEGLTLGAAAGVEASVMKEILREGIANSAVLGLWSDLGSRWKGMLKATTPGVTPPNMRKDLHLVLELARELGVPLYLGTQGSLIADAGVAAGHDDPLL